MSEWKMKIMHGRSLIAILAVSFLLAFAAPVIGGASSAFAASSGDKKMLIIYYSWGGNTRAMAEQVRSLTGADIFELQTVDPYPKKYRSATEQAKREQSAGHRPPLSSKIDNLAEYDVVFIGSPNWWGALAMPFFTFLEEHNMAGKTLIPFMTHEGSAFGKTLADLKTLCPDAVILEGLAVRGGRVGGARPDIEKWLKKIGVIQ